LLGVSLLICKLGLMWCTVARCGSVPGPQRLRIKIGQHTPPTTRDPTTSIPHACSSICSADSAEGLTSQQGTGVRNLDTVDSGSMPHLRSPSPSV
jgi:hypothetical protein